MTKARHYLELARSKTSSPFEHEIIDRKLAKCSE
jgi:hypothetical protein